jgi:hypothetical protein
MVPIGRGRVHIMVGVVHQVDHPKRLYLMLHPMCGVGAYQVQEHDPQDYIEPQGHFWQPVDDPKLVFHRPIRGLQQQKRQRKVYDDRGQCKKEIGNGMSPFFIGYIEQGYDSFQNPKKSNPPYQDQASV